MLATLPMILGALALPLASATGQITGSGTITVLNGTYSAATPDDAVGCVNAAGKITTDDCAVFTVQDYHIYTSEGICSFYNTAQPANTDSVYGKNSYAFACWDHETVSTDTQFYTISGFAYDFMCQGDTNCYYDVPALPVTSDDEIDVWRYLWGGQQTTVPAGHYQTVFLWEPTN